MSENDCPVILYPIFILVSIRVYVEIPLIQSLLLRQEKVVAGRSTYRQVKEY
jgi:hypothetical protein